MKLLLLPRGLAKAISTGEIETVKRCTSFFVFAVLLVYFYYCYFVLNS